MRITELQFIVYTVIGNCVGSMKSIDVPKHQKEDVTPKGVDNHPRDAFVIGKSTGLYTTLRIIGNPKEIWKATVADPIMV
jgi:hypothetical protein